MGRNGSTRWEEFEFDFCLGSAEHNCCRYIHARYTLSRQLQYVYPLQLRSTICLPLQPICIERVLFSAIKYESLVLPPLSLSPRISLKVQCRLSLTEKVNMMSLIWKFCFCFANDTISLFCQSHGHLATFLWFFRASPPRFNC